MSNFNNEDLKNILDAAEIKPVVNQIIYHIGMTQDVNQPFTEANGLLVQAYSPIGTGRLLRMPELQEIAAHYDRSVAQLAIRYALAKGRCHYQRLTTLSMWRKMRMLILRLQLQIWPCSTLLRCRTNNDNLKTTWLGACANQVVFCADVFF